jgi:superfamily II DNA or RNA helicase
MSKKSAYYSPACQTVWGNGRRLKATKVFDKYGPSKFQYLSEELIQAHLMGRHTIGTYAIRPDDTCTFLAADFDGDGWKQAACAYIDEAAAVGVSALLEISRSGNGAHVWIFFAESVPAFMARRMGSLILGHVSAKTPHVSLDSYDRFFPNQDKLPRGGFGNLIALPLQKQKRDHGYTVFVDKSLNPISNQWEALAQVNRLSREGLETIIQDSLGTVQNDEYSGDEIEELIQEITELDPITIPVIEDQTIHLSENIEITTHGLPPVLIAKLKRLATFPNPVFFEKQRQRFPTYNIPKYIFSGEFHSDRIILPRGCLEQAIDLFAECGSRATVVDRRLKPKGIKTRFTGDLRPIQEKAVTEIKRHEWGVLVAPPGAGKTVMACSLIGSRKMPTLVLVSRQALLDQWIERVKEFTDIDPKEIGELRSGKHKLKGKIDVAMIQTLVNREDRKRLFREYGMVIIDECHHVPAVTMEQLLKNCGSKFIIGLTATPKRKDGLERLLYFQCGPIRHVMPESDSDRLVKQVHLRETQFSASDTPGEMLPLHKVWGKLIKCNFRNRIITQDIFDSAKAGRVSIILSDRKEHLSILQDELNRLDSSDEIHVFSVDGSLSKKTRTEKIQTFVNLINEEKPACLFSTSALLGEGFDLPCLDTLVLMKGNASLKFSTTWMITYP